LNELTGDRRLAVVTASKRRAPFFEMVLAHTMQGFLRQPAARRQPRLREWRMLRVPASPVRGRILYDLRQGKES